MIAAIKFCAFNYWTNTWSKQNVIEERDQYYKSHIIDVHNPNMSYDIDIQYKINEFSVPTMWTSTVELKQYIDTPMRLIFQGVLKPVIEISFLFLTQYKKKQQFKSDVHETM